MLGCNQRKSIQLLTGEDTAVPRLPPGASARLLPRNTNRCCAAGLCCHDCHPPSLPCCRALQQRVGEENVKRAA